MWNQVFILALLQLLRVSSSPVEPIEGPLWMSKFNDIPHLKEDFRDLESSDEDDLSYYNDLSEKDLNIKGKRTFLTSLKSSSEKRALSMFARWGPINTIGKERNPIRSGYPPKSFNSISTQTRSRMLGQPLRWG